MGCIAAWAFVRDIKRGVASDGTWTFSASGNPLGYCAVMAGKLFVFGFGVAELLFSANLIGDPFLKLSAFMHAIGLG